MRDWSRATPAEREAEQQRLIAKALANTHWKVLVGPNKTRDTLIFLRRGTAADLRAARDERDWQVERIAAWRAVEANARPVLTPLDQAVDVLVDRLLKRLAA